MFSKRDFKHANLAAIFGGETSIFAFVQCWQKSGKWEFKFANLSYIHCIFFITTHHLNLYSNIEKDIQMIPGKVILAYFVSAVKNLELKI